MGGITFAVAAPILAKVVANGVCADDERVRSRADEATKAILDELTPVGGMATYNVQVGRPLNSGVEADELLLPKQLENAIDTEVLDPGTILSSDRIRQSFTDPVNNFAFIDPAFEHDSPLVDQFLVPDPEENMTYADGTTTNGSPNIGSALANFTSADLFKPISGVGIPSNSYIGQINSENQIALSSSSSAHVPVNATATATGVSITITGRGNPAILRRKYQFPGISADAICRITGKKRFIPIASNDDYLIVQNLLALKLMILSIENAEHGLPDEAAKYRAQSIDLLQKEVKQHLLDPRHFRRRKAAYERDLSTYPRNSFGWTLARLALELPGAMLKGKSELTRILQMAEMRIMEGGMFVGVLEPFKAEVVGGCVHFPKTVECVVAAAYCEQPIDIRSMLFRYIRNGPGFSDCGGIRLIDEGEQYYPATQNTRRVYRLTGASETEGHTLNFVAKLRYIDKAPDEQMTIKNFEAIRLMTQALMHEANEKWNEAAAAQNSVRGVLDRELGEYLAGIKHAIPIETRGYRGYKGANL